MALSEKETQEVIEWIRSRPDKIKKVMLLLPPGCVVKCKPEHPLRHPAPGHTAQLVCYTEKASGEVIVKVQDGRVLADCDPEWLDVAEYAQGITPEFVRLACEGGLK